MNRTKIVAVALCLAMMNYVLPTTVFADGAKTGTVEETMDYAQREAQSVGLENFEGGSATGTLVFILLVAAIAAIVWYLMDQSRHGRHGMAPADESTLANSSVPAPATGGR